jgi:hypothetical protein
MKKLSTPSKCNYWYAHAGAYEICGVGIAKNPTRLQILSNKILVEGTIPTPLNQFKITFWASGLKNLCL